MSGLAFGSLRAWRWFFLYFGLLRSKLSGKNTQPECGATPGNPKKSRTRRLTLTVSNRVRLQRGGQTNVRRISSCPWRSSRRKGPMRCYVPCITNLAETLEADWMIFEQYRPVNSPRRPRMGHVT